MSGKAQKSMKFSSAEPENDALARQQLAKILASERFRRSKSLPALLRFIVEETLAGREERLKARTIAVDAFDRSKDFDPRLDPIVSIQAGRLRRALNDYYAGEGATGSRRPVGTARSHTHSSHQLGRQP